MFCRSEFNIFYRILWLQASCYIILYFCEKRFLLWMSIYIHLLYFQGRGLTNLDVLFSCRYLISSLLHFIHLSFILVIHFFIPTFCCSYSISIFGNRNLPRGIFQLHIFHHHFSHIHVLHLHLLIFNFYIFTFFIFVLLFCPSFLFL